jgi:lipid II:glycine glycyltransferase (peptidoglycan interpeptide bridge formation enzyme)
MPEVTPSEWGNFLANVPDSHILQTYEWGVLKSEFGWYTRHILLDGSNGDMSVGAQILFRRLPFGLSAAYIGKGPVTCQPDGSERKGWSQFWLEVDQLCRRERAVFLKVEPDIWEKTERTNWRETSNFLPEGFYPSHQTVQPRRTLVVDLTGSEEDVLARMKQKTRYNIRLAKKKSVVVDSSEDLEIFYRLMTLTSQRDAFGVHTQEYYQRAFALFHPQSLCVLLQASFEDEPLAGLIAFRYGSRAWYFYGASGNEHRELMPTYLVQWEAMRWARIQGCVSYDLWGIPDFKEEELEAEFANRVGELWGVYRFKRGFGGQMMRTVGAWDRIYQPIPFKFYRWWYRNRAEA